MLSPCPGVTRLTLDDITMVDGQMFIRLGDPPAPVPAPFDDLINAYLQARPHMSTAGNPDSTWLFPCRSPRQPLHPTSIRLRLQQLGIPNLSGRSRALRELLLQAPPSVVAGMLGYGTSRAEPSPAKPAPPGSPTQRATTTALERLRSIGNEEHRAAVK